MQLHPNDCELKLGQALNLKEVLLVNLRHTSYDNIKQILAIGDHLSKVTAIIEMLELVQQIPDSFDEWLDNMTFSWYENEFTVNGLPILDYVDVFEDDTVLYICECHDGSWCNQSRIEPGAYQYEYGGN